MLISRSEKVKQGMGHPSVFTRFVYSKYLRDLEKNSQDRHRSVFPGMDVKVACQLNVCVSILVCRNHAGVRGRFFRVGLRLRPEDSWTNTGK